MTNILQLWTTLLAWFEDRDDPVASEPAGETQSAAVEEDGTRRALTQTTREQIDWYEWSHHTPI